MNLLKRNSDIGDPSEYDFEDCYTVQNPEGPISERDLVAGILKHNGNYAAIASDLNRTRAVVFNIIARHDEYRSLVEDIRQAILDHVEHGVLTQAMNGDPSQARFVLTTLAKDRGFVTREERTGRDGEPIHTKSTIDVSQLDNATLEKLMEAGEKTRDGASG